MDNMEAPDTGRVALRQLAESLPPKTSEESQPATRHDLAVIARQVDTLLTKAQEAQGANRIWRGLGGLAATLAISIGAYALNLAVEASRDHDRLGRLEVDLSATANAVEELQRTSSAQGTTLATSAARIDAQLDRVDDLLTRVDRRLDAFDQRLTTIERGH
jgi:hypothetical protein